MSKQTKNGNKGETIAAGLLNENGYWAHILAKSESGSQPFDIVAIKGNKDSTSSVWMVDAKYVNENKVSFTIERVESNQLSSMEYAINFANINEKQVGFVVVFERDLDNPRFLPYRNVVEGLENKKRSFNIAEMQSLKTLLKMASLPK